MDALQKKICLAIVNVFESGSVTGNYGSVTVLKGDSGHLTYGRSQTTLGSGHLFSLLSAYCSAPDALQGEEIKPFLDRVAKKDFTLDSDTSFKAILREAGHDPAMQREQDDFFERAFFNPAMLAAQNAGLQRPLSKTIVYDSHIQGGWSFLSHLVTREVGRVGAGVDEPTWITNFVEARTEFLKGGKKPLPTTVYRMEAFRSMISGGKWDLPLSLIVHGVNITPASFADSPPPPAVRVSVPEPEVDSHPILLPALPYAKGAEVLALQKLLVAAGLPNSQDQIYGPFTQALVKKFQQSKKLKPDAVVGPQTWAMLQAGVAGTN